MSASPFLNSTKTRRSRKNTKVTNRLKTRLEEQNNVSLGQNVVKFKRSIPDELTTILRLEKVSLVLSFILILTTLGLYSWAVSAPKIWSKNYQKLEKLQSDERNLITNNETLKNHLAKQAKNPASGLTDAKPYQAIFLPATKVTKATSSQKTKKEAASTVKEKNQPIETPISY